MANTNLYSVANECGIPEEKNIKVILSKIHKMFNLNKGFSLQSRVGRLREVHIKEIMGFGAPPSPKIIFTPYLYQHANQR